MFYSSKRLAKSTRNNESVIGQEYDSFGEDETKQPERKYLLKENMFENISSLIGFGASDDDFQNKLG